MSWLSKERVDKYWKPVSLAVASGLLFTAIRGSQPENNPNRSVHQPDRRAGLPAAVGAVSVSSPDFADLSIDEVIASLTEEPAIEAIPKLTVEPTATPVAEPTPAPTLEPDEDEDESGSGGDNPEPEIFPTGAETSHSFNSDLMDFDISTAADLQAYLDRVEATYQASGQVPDFALYQALTGDLHINPGTKLEDFGLGVTDGLRADLVRSEEVYNASLTEDGTFRRDAFSNPEAAWYEENGVRYFVQTADNYDELNRKMVWAAAGYNQHYADPETWANLSQQQKAQLGRSTYTSWILDTRDSAKPTDPQYVVTNEDGVELFQLYDPAYFTTRRIQLSDRPDSRAGQIDDRFVYQCVRIQDPPGADDSAVAFSTFNRQGDYLLVIVDDGEEVRTEVFALDEEYQDRPESYQVGLEPEDDQQPGDNINPMKPGCAPAAPAQPTPMPESPAIVPPPQTPPPEETPPPRSTPEKSNPGNQTNLDGETQPDPEGGLVIIDGQIDTNSDGTGDSPDNIGSGR